MRAGIDGGAPGHERTLADVATRPSIGQTVARASIDGFDRLRSERYRWRSSSPTATTSIRSTSPLRTLLLEPLGPTGVLPDRNGSLEVRTDPRSRAATDRCDCRHPRPDTGDQRLPSTPERARRSWSSRWLRRSPRRRRDAPTRLGGDVDLVSSPAEIEQRYRERYSPGQSSATSPSCDLRAGERMSASSTTTGALRP